MQQISAKVYGLFREELQRHLESAHQELLTDTTTPTVARARELGACFHTIRGGAGFLGFEEVANRAERLEFFLRKSTDSLVKNMDDVRSLVRELEDLVTKLPHNTQE